MSESASASFYTSRRANVTRTIVTGIFLAIAALAHASQDRPEAAIPEPDRLTTGYVYFADTTGRFLKAVQVQMPDSPDVHERVNRILDTLIQGPPADLTRTLPAETKINAAYVTDDGSAYVDLDDVIRRKLPGGAEKELLAVYSIVNSLILNLPEIETVKLLVQGMDAQTLAGHIDTTAFFKANMLIIR